jgi:hypothetical protein
MANGRRITNFPSKINFDIFWSCFLANILLFFGLLTRDRLYIDDIGRSMYGNLGWTDAGRPLADIFTKIIQLGTPLNNSFPLPQIISIFMISLTCTLLAQKYSIKSPIIAAICTLPLAGQPYYLENMSYTFDSPSMTLGLSLSIYAAITLADKKKYSLFIAAILIFMALNLYQACVGAFFVTYMFLAIKNINIKIKPHEYFLDHITRLTTGSGLALLSYIPVAHKLLAGDYDIEHSRLIGFHNAYDKIFQNTADYVGAIIRHWSGNAIGYIFAFIFVSYLIASIFRAVWSGYRFSINKRIFLYVVLSLVIGVLTVVASYFPQMLLENPILAPRAFVGFGALLSCCCLYVWSTLEVNDFGFGKYEQYIKAIPVCLVAYALITFSYSYSRANVAQKEYEDTVISRLIADTDELKASHKLTHVTIIGKMGYSPLVTNTIRKYPLIASLVPIHISNSWSWGYRQLKYMGLDLMKFNIRDQDKFEIMDKHNPVVNKSKYAIYLLDDLMVIRFNN